MSLGIPSFRPTMMGGRHAVSSGHYLATAAGFRILEAGGNAVDAGVAAGIALNVVLPTSTNFGGVAAILICDGRQETVTSISGLGRWPRAVRLDEFVKRHGGQIPSGVEQVVVPSAADAWMTALMEHGTMSFEQVVSPALEYARDGFAVGHYLAKAFQGFSAGEGNFPTTAANFAPGGAFPRPGERLVQPALTRTFERLIAAERRSAGKSRVAGIEAARAFFYTGEIAEEIVAFVQGNGGYLAMGDMADFHVGHEPPEVGRFGNYEVYTNGPWCQGPVVAETVQILAGDDLVALGHNSPEYVHLVAEALKLSFADRDAFYGDPDFVDVPMRGLLDPGYAEQQRGRIDPDKAWPAMPPAGDPWAFEGRAAPPDHLYQPPDPSAATSQPDTSYACAVDRWGNLFSVTPSDAAGVIIPALGFSPSTRGSQSWLDPRHPSALAPWKRPRLTPNALMAFKDGKPWMAFGTPGGDAQTQATLQFFLNIAAFGMPLQQAVEEPRFLVWSFPDSFWPHSYTPGRVELERRFDTATAYELGRRGHLIEWLDVYAGRADNVCGIALDRAQGTIAAAADLRGEAYAIAR